MIRFFILANKLGQTRLSRYYEYIPVRARVRADGERLGVALTRSAGPRRRLRTDRGQVEERVVTEAEIVRKCLSRIDAQARRRAGENGGVAGELVPMCVCPVGLLRGVAADRSAPSWSTATTRLCTAAMPPCSSLWALTAKRSAAAPRRRAPGVWSLTAGEAAGRVGHGRQNELGILELIHTYVETLDSQFQNVVRRAPHL